MNAQIEANPLFSSVVSFPGAGIARAPALNAVRAVIIDKRCIMIADSKFRKYVMEEN